MKDPKKRTLRTVGKVIYVILVSLIVIVAYAALFSARWFGMKYGDTGFDSVLFTLFSDLSGTAEEIMLSYYNYAIPPTVIFSALTLFLLFFRSASSLFLNIGRKIRIKFYPLNKTASSLIAVVLLFALLFHSSTYLGIPEYIVKMTTDSKFYEDEYVFPEDVALSFPEKKRNLIYIYLESMENTFFSKEEGGVLENNAMPELLELAKNNVNFSTTDGVGGCFQASGATWTIAAMVSQTSGIPLMIPIDSNTYGDYSEFLPGVTSITDILSDNGYYQTLVLGSDASFGGRSKYFGQHGVDEIRDIHTAHESGLIPEDYFVWWGMEDEYLYEYSKQTLTELASKDEPFAFYTLTVDTHSPKGYVCDLCDDEYEEQYVNVYSCASRQLASFIEWIQEQDFYENTAIVISGDHISMDFETVSAIISDESYERRVYNCFINSAVEPIKTKERDLSQFDMFPSTLAAMGVEIPGERLGLGVNLFSGEMTLSEKYGFATFNELQSTNSYMYDTNFLYGQNSKKSK